MDPKTDNRHAEQPAALEKGTAADESTTVVQSSSADHKLRWADIWENKRVLGFSAPTHFRQPLNFQTMLTATPSQPS
jgi:hypothetical protein